MFENDTETPAVPYAGESTFTDRNAELKRLAEATGLRLPTTILPEGTSLYDIGEENKRKMAQTVDALPDVATAIVGLKAVIAAQAPQDFSTPVQMLAMDPKDGAIQTGSTALAYSPAGFGQIAQLVKPSTVRNGFTENLLALPNELRAQVFNHHARNSVRDASDRVTLRTIRDPQSDRRVVRAVTSSKHSLETGDDLAICDRLAPHGSLLPDLRGAKARITRGMDRSEFELIWPAMDRQLVVGDIALMGVRIVNSETKASTLKVEAFLLRVLCANFTTAESDDDNADEISLRHVGDLRWKLADAFAKAQKRIEPFVRRFADAYKLALPRTRGEVLAQVAKVHKLPESTMTLAAQMWDRDGEKTAGDTLAGLANALTRASQEAPISVASDIERAAGQLIAKGFRSIGLN